MDEEKEKKSDFLDRPGAIRKLWIMLYVICGLTLVPDFFIDREPHFGIDTYFGFFAFLGFISCIVLILLAKASGVVLKREENYYD